jgi:hypothetical protein
MNITISSNGPPPVVDVVVPASATIVNVSPAALNSVELIALPGPPGPQGPEGGTPVVAVPFDQWPPVSPQPDTLYLRLEP